SGRGARPDAAGAAAVAVGAVARRRGPTRRRGGGCLATRVGDKAGGLGRGHSPQRRPGPGGTCRSPPGAGAGPAEPVLTRYAAPGMTRFPLVAGDSTNWIFH